MKRSIKIVLLGSFMMGAMAVVAQPSFDYAAIRSTFPDKDYYMLKKAQSIVISEQNGKLSMESSEVSDILYLSERSTRAAEKTVPLSAAFSKLNKLEAKTWVPVGSGKLKAVPVEKILTRKPVKDGIFFDDGEERYFIYPSLVQGAVASLEVEEEILDPHLLGTYLFASGIPVRESMFKVTFPENVKVSYKLLNDVKKMVEVKEEKRRGKMSYTFIARNLDEIKFEENAPDFRYYSPHVILYVEQYQSNGEMIKVLPDLKGLFDWYNSLVEKVQNDASTELKALADSILRSNTTKMAQLKSAVYWQQDKIKYIAFEDGLGGFIPRNPSDVLRKRYGDCKDKAYLLSLLLNQMGFEAYPAWIGTRDIPYSYHEVATPAVDNHMITALRLNDHWFFLDGTSHFLPMEMPTSMIQGKEAMIRLNADSFLIERVPEMPKEKSIRKDKFVLALDGRNLKGSGFREFTGYFQQSMQMNLDFLSPVKRDEQVLKGLKIASNKYKADHLRYSGYGQRDTSLMIQYDLSVNDYAEEIDGKLYLNLNLLRMVPLDKSDWKKREVGISFDYNYSSEYELELEVPAGYTVASVPEPVSLSNQLYGMDVKYLIRDNKVVLNHRFWIDTLLIPVDGLADWNAYYEKLLAGYKTVVILKKK